MGHPAPVQGVTHSTRLFVGVVSACQNRAKRDAVRDTWGSDPRLVRVVFVVGRPASSEVLDAVRLEARQKGDIIFAGHVSEHYLNITYQTLEIFRAAHAYHGSITHVLKCDDDSYIQVDRLQQLLLQHSFNHTWIGSMETAYQPIRDPSSKWYVSKAEWSEDSSAIKWSHGPGYVLTTDLVTLLVVGGVAKCAPGPLFKLEDVAVGSWLTCLERLENITINMAHASINLGGCSEHDVVSHYMQPSQMRCMFAQGGKCCR